MAAISQLEKSVSLLSKKFAILQNPSEKYNLGSMRFTYPNQIRNNWKSK